jgi:hypothetical protein
MEVILLKPSYPTCLKIIPYHILKKEMVIVPHILWLDMIPQQNFGIDEMNFGYWLKKRQNQSIIILQGQQSQKIPAMNRK